MKQAWRNFVRTLLAGVFFLAPILLIVWIAMKIIRALAALLDPIAHLLPFPSILGLKSPEVAALFLLIVVTYLAGLVARTAIARGISLRAERLILRKVPGYTLIKSAAHGAIGESPDVKCCLAFIDDAWLMAFIIEEREGEELRTVFVPSAPTPTAGNVYFMREGQIRRLDVPVAAAIKCIMQLGVGSSALLQHQIQSPQAASTQTQGDRHASSE
jgi:uncharacterized membrane protein